MKKSRQWFSVLTLIAFVFTTTMPAASHAMPHNDGKVVQTNKTETTKGHDCHGHGEAKADTNKAVQNDKDVLDKCCDKSMCKCVGGTCHNGLSQYLGNSGNSLSAISSGGLVFAFNNQFVDSILLEGLKRPPRA